MSTLALKFRGPLIAVAVLLLSAGLALAGGGLTFPDAGREATDGSAPTIENEDGQDGDNHGDLVSEAAQMATPEGFRNHGAFVSCVARKLYLRDDPGAEPAEEVVLAELTPEDCERDDEEEAEADEADTTDEWDNHGDLVSEAAQMETPVAAEGAEGFRNHGAFVSCVARMRYGHKGSEAPADFALAELTQEDCDRSAEDAAAGADDGPGRSDKARGKGHGWGNGRGHGRGG